ncbi:arylsulfotransferase family protein [Nocardiopsis alba]|uniref:arylsulfotransferase family protein n=1 Tax=Nocardiopsis alba TaxID=53437 RepID=UPI0033BFA328
MNRHLLFSPSSTYPMPVAYLVDHTGRVVHTWSSGEEQPDAADRPPGYLRGWNHVELGPDGCLYALVPLHALLRLGPDGHLVWKRELPVHHDLDIDAQGRVHVLTERPRTVVNDHGDRPRVILDNTVAVLDTEGRPVEEYSLYDLLTADPELRPLVHDLHERRWGAFADSGWTPSSAWEADLVERAEYRGPTRDALRYLRDLPGSPADVLHANTVELLGDHPGGLWRAGDVLLSFRDLDLVVVANPAARRVRWWWGPGTLSGQHQPSALAGGTVLLLDNGRSRGRSRVLEYDPVIEEVVWRYTADPPEDFFTEVAGGCEISGTDRVLVTDAQAGRAFEVDRSGRVLWEMRVHPPATGARRSRASVYRISLPPEEGVRAVLDQVRPEVRDIDHPTIAHARAYSSTAER